MYKLILPAFAAMLLFSAGRAAGAEFTLTCAWERGGKFELKISNSRVFKNGHTVSDQVSISDSQITWHETSLAGFDYDYSMDRQSGILIATTFSKMYSRKVEDKAYMCEGGRRRRDRILVGTPLSRLFSSLCHYSILDRA